MHERMNNVLGLKNHTFFYYEHWTNYDTAFSSHFLEKKMSSDSHSLGNYYTIAASVTELALYACTNAQERILHSYETNDLLLGRIETVPTSSEYYRKTITKSHSPDVFYRMKEIVVSDYRTGLDDSSIPKKYEVSSLQHASRSTPSASAFRA